MIDLHLEQSAMDHLREIQIGCKALEVRILPMQMKDPIYGNKDLNFQEFFAPAVILTYVPKPS